MRDGTPDDPEPVTAVTAVTGGPEDGEPPRTGEEFLNILDQFIDTRVDLTEEKRTVAVLWACHTYIFRRFKHTPKLFVTGVKEGLGKSELVEVVCALSHKGFLIEGRFSEAAFCRMQEVYGDVTLGLDQLDNLSVRDAESFFDKLCASTKVGASTLISVSAKGKWEPKPFIIGIPMILSRIGDFSSRQLNSRLITIRMQPARPERHNALEVAQETKLFAGFGAPTPEMRELRQAMWNILEPAGEEIASRHYETPIPCDQRTRVLWRPLFGIAAWAGGDWIRRAGEAFVELYDPDVAKEPDAMVHLRKIAVALSELSNNPAEAVSPDELLRMSGANVTKDQQGKWLRELGINSKVYRWTKGKEPWRAYSVAEIMVAINRWIV